MSLRGPDSLLASLNRIKDVRNLCAHDERLYCARVGKPATRSVSDVLRDLALVVRSVDHAQTLAYVDGLLDGLSSSIPTPALDYVMRSMGWECEGA